MGRLCYVLVRIYVCFDCYRGRTKAVTSFDDSTGIHSAIVIYDSWYLGGGGYTWRYSYTVVLRSYLGGVTVIIVE